MNTSAPKKILFVSHDASRTGAPIVLKHLLYWLKLNTEIEFHLLLKTAGDLEKDFRAIVPVYVWSPKTSLTSIYGRMFNRAHHFLFKRYFFKPFPKRLKKINFDIIYLNTVASHEFVMTLKDNFSAKFISHVHENQFTINNFYPTALNKSIVDQIDRFITVSKISKENLIKNYGIPESDVLLIHEFVPVNNFKAPTKTKEELKDELKIGNAFIVGASGLASWRKGVDIFIAVAKKIIKDHPTEQIIFFWVGAFNKEFKCQLDYELERLEIVGKIFFTGSLNNPQDYFQFFDVFILTSREDPFPLVCLEAAALGKPIICFQNAGGMPEFLEKGGGMIVPYADVEGMASAIICLKQKAVLRNKLGAEAKNQVKEFDVSLMAPKILEIINSLLN